MTTINSVADAGGSTSNACRRTSATPLRPTLLARLPSGSFRTCMVIAMGATETGTGPAGRPRIERMPASAATGATN